MDLPKILIVDDREFDRIIYREYLGETNYKFEEMEDGTGILAVSYTHLRAHETEADLVCRLLLEKKK